MSYRNDLEAARARRNALARELQTIECDMDQLEQLRQRRDEVERELTAHSKVMDRERARLSLPLLSTVKVASPCKVSWDDMTGDDMMRFCSQCEKNVFDLSAMSAEQAESLLRDVGEEMCIRFYRRADGTVMTGDCPVGQRRRRRRNKIAGAIIGGLAALGVGGLVASAVSDRASSTEATSSVEVEIDEDEPPAEYSMGLYISPDCANSVLGCD